MMMMIIIIIMIISATLVIIRIIKVTHQDCTSFPTIQEIPQDVGAKASHEDS